jgi:hypothetical protein
MSTPIKLLPALVLGIVGAMFAATPALAFPITYTEMATATGCLGNVMKVGGVITCAGGTAFTSALVTITMSNDTSNVSETDASTGLFENIGAAGTVTVTVGGLGSATFSDQIAAFSHQTVAVAGFADLSFTPPLDILDTGNTSFATYDLKSFIGPLSGSPAFTSINQIFPTSDGGFVLTSEPTSSTFTAAVPAPSIGRGFLVLLAVSGVLFGANLSERRRKRRSVAS